MLLFFSCTLHMLRLRFRNDCYRCKVLALDAEHMKILTHPPTLYIEVSLRNAGERLHRNLSLLCDNMVLKLLSSRLRQERKHRHGLAKHLEGLIYKQP